MSNFQTTCTNLKSNKTPISLQYKRNVHCRKCKQYFICFLASEPEYPKGKAKLSHPSMYLLYNSILPCTYCTTASLHVLTVQQHPSMYLLYNSILPCTYCTTASLHVLTVQRILPCNYCKTASLHVLTVHQHPSMYLLHIGIPPCTYCLTASFLVVTVQQKNNVRQNPGLFL